jgi:xylan 1,4-beta-xylosidase
MGNERVEVTSSAALATEDVVRDGIREMPDINAIATRKKREVEILLWNYHDDDIPFPDAPINLVITGLPADAKRPLVEHFRVDSSHSDSFTAWKEMGSPQSPSEADYKRLESAGQMQLLNSPAWIDTKQGSVELKFMLPRQGLSLVRISW